MSKLDPGHREMLKLRLNGGSVEEISKATGRSGHQVRRVLKKVRQDLEVRLQTDT